MVDFDTLGGVVKPYVDTDQYGVGVPFAFAVAGVAVIAFAFPGLTQFAGLTVYGKIGVLVLLAVAIACIAVAGYTFRDVDIDEFVDRKDDLREGDGSMQNETPGSASAGARDARPRGVPSDGDSDDGIPRHRISSEHHSDTDTDTNSDSYPVPLSDSDA